MKYKKINIKDYNNEPIQYVGYYILHAQDLNLPKPEVFFVEDDETTDKKIE